MWVGKGGVEISKHEYNPGKMTMPKGMGRIVITFRLGRFCRTEQRTRGQKLVLIQDRFLCVCVCVRVCVMFDMKHYIY